MVNKSVIIFSGGIDSICTCIYLKKKFDMYGISFMYGQRAKKEISIARFFSKKLGLKDHKIINMEFMKNIYGKTNVLSDTKQKIPNIFNYSIIVPIRNVVFLSIAGAWAFSLKSTLLAYGAHKGDKKYPDCRPEFTSKFEKALNQGEHDAIRSRIRKKIKIWSPFIGGLTKSSLLKIGHKEIGDLIFKTWSCYHNGRIHCGKCESCNNRKNAFIKAKIVDETKYSE